MYKDGKKVKNGAAVFAALMCALSVILSFSSCSKPPDIAEYRDTFTDLIEKSAEINEVLFGVGLPTDEEPPDGFEEFLGYSYVSDDAKYHSINEIRDAAAKVYSSAYMRSIDGIFAGYADNEIGVVTARFDESLGALLQAEGLSPLNGTRKFDFSTMKTVKPCSSKVINVSVTTWIEGGHAIEGLPKEENEKLDGKPYTMTLTFVFENAWRLDTPTY